MFMSFSCLCSGYLPFYKMTMCIIVDIDVIDACWYMVVEHIENKKDCVNSHFQWF